MVAMICFSGDEVLTSRSVSGSCISASIVGSGLFRTLLKILCGSFLSFPSLFIHNQHVGGSTVLAADEPGDLVQLSLLVLYLAVPFHLLLLIPRMRRLQCLVSAVTCASFPVSYIVLTFQNPILVLVLALKTSIFLSVVSPLSLICLSIL